MKEIMTTYYSIMFTLDYVEYSTIDKARDSCDLGVLTIEKGKIHTSGSGNEYELNIVKLYDRDLNLNNFKLGNWYIYDISQPYFTFVS
jgi:hypothetical protein